MESIPKQVLDPATADRLAELALDGIKREYPNSLERFMANAKPRAIHPAFYGCYDWHSAVHSHWTLVRLLRSFPDWLDVKSIRAALDTNLTAENLQAEIANFGQSNLPMPDITVISRPGQPTFERPYGWGWLLQLTAELYLWQDANSQKWLQNLQPLSQKIVELFSDFLTTSNLPNRTGQHRNTAFALTLALDYARTCGQSELEDLIIQYGIDNYANNKAYPTQSEPGPNDFLSPALEEADFMWRVLTPAAFADWFSSFLPDLASGQPATLLQPVLVSNHSDPLICHLDGLNLSRAWCWYGIAEHLPEQTVYREILLQATKLHAQAGLDAIFEGDFRSTGHWLGTFGVYLLTSPFIKLDYSLA